MYFAQLDDKTGKCFLCTVAEDIVIEHDIKFHSENEQEVIDFCKKWNRNEMQTRKRTDAEFKAWEGFGDMREILFKAKREEWKELPKEEWWVEGSFLHAFQEDKQSAICGIHRDVYFIVEENGRMHVVDPATICQYTGLKDKNKKKIFEGDIYTLCSIAYTAKLTGIIRFGEYEQDGSDGKYPPVSVIGFYFEVIKIQPAEDGFFNEYYPEWDRNISLLGAMKEGLYEKCEYIGNIFETPELIEKTVP